MQTIYINGVKASKDDLNTLFQRVKNGKDYILEIRMTKAQNVAIITA